MDEAAKKRAKLNKEVNRVMIELKTHKYVIALYNDLFEENEKQANETKESNK